MPLGHRALGGRETRSTGRVSTPFQVQGGCHPAPLCLFFGHTPSRGAYLVGFTAFVLTIVLGILGIALGVRLLRGGRGSAAPRIDDGRLERLEGALSSLESRVEELQDQQRFVEKLLSDRASPRSLGSGSGPARREGASEGEAVGDGDGPDSILFETGEGEPSRDG